jgi:hypothetical protein
MGYSYAQSACRAITGGRLLNAIVNNVVEHSNLGLHVHYPEGRSVKYTLFLVSRDNFKIKSLIESEAASYFDPNQISIHAIRSLKVTEDLVAVPGDPSDLKVVLNAFCTCTESARGNQCFHIFAVVSSFHLVSENKRFSINCFKSQSDSNITSPCITVEGLKSVQLSLDKLREKKSKTLQQEVEKVKVRRAQLPRFEMREDQSNPFISDIIYEELGGSVPTEELDRREELHDFETPLPALANSVISLESCISSAQRSRPQKRKASESVQSAIDQLKSATRKRKKKQV